MAITARSENRSSDNVDPEQGFIAGGLQGENSVHAESQTIPTIHKHYPEPPNHAPVNPNHVSESKFWGVFWILESVLSLRATAGLDLFHQY